MCANFLVSAVSLFFLCFHNLSKHMEKFYKNFFQETVRELEGEINRLEKEKADLNVALNNAKTEHPDG